MINILRLVELHHCANKIMAQYRQRVMMYPFVSKYRISLGNAEKIFYRLDTKLWEIFSAQKSYRIAYIRARLELVRREEKKLIEELRNSK